MSAEGAATGRVRRALRAALVAVTAAACTGPAPTVAPVRAGVTGGGIAWEVAGRGPAVVLIPGSNLDRRVWDAQMAPLARHYTVVRYDLRGHGRSADAAGPFSGPDDLRGVLDAVDPGPVRLVGLSYGARVAVDFALADPARVSALVLVSPTVSGFAGSERPDWWAPMMDAVRAGDAERAADLLARSPLMAVGPADSGAVRRMVRENARLFRQTGRERPAAAPAWGRLAELTMPVLVVTGADDGADILRVADAVAAAAPLARQERIAGAGHLVNVAAASRFNALLAGFFGGAGAPRSGSRGPR